MWFVMAQLYLIFFSSDVLSGMKVEQTVPQPQLSRAEQVRQALRKAQPLPKTADKTITSQLQRRQPSKYVYLSLIHI